MFVKCKSDNRDLIIRILENETASSAHYDFSPGFACRVGEFTLTRSGLVVSDSPGSENAFRILLSLDLCELPADCGSEALLQAETDPGRTFKNETVLTDKAPDEFCYSMSGHTGPTLMKLLRILSARYILLNRSLSVCDAFYVDKTAMRKLLHHPPCTKEEFLQLLYPCRDSFKGVSFNSSEFQLHGFRKSRHVPTPICKQLSDHIVYAAVTRHWIKPFTTNSRNKKYAMRSWLYTLGMDGEEYAEARHFLLENLPGRTDRKS